MYRSKAAVRIYIVNNFHPLYYCISEKQLYYKGYDWNKPSLRPYNLIIHLDSPEDLENPGDQEIKLNMIFQNFDDSRHITYSNTRIYSNLSGSKYYVKQIEEYTGKISESNLRKTSLIDILKNDADIDHDTIEKNKNIIDDFEQSLSIKYKLDPPKDKIVINKNSMIIPFILASLITILVGATTKLITATIILFPCAFLLFLFLFKLSDRIDKTELENADPTPEEFRGGPWELVRVNRCCGIKLNETREYGYA